MERIKLLDIEKDNIVNMYNGGASTVAIAKVYKCNQSTIESRLKGWSVNVRPMGKHIINDNVFDKSNEQSMYWLGYIAGDGNIEGGTNRIGITSIDKDHLEKFCIFMGTDSRLISYVHSGVYQARFSSERIRGYLNSIGITENKTNTLNIANKKIYRNRDFIRGVFDANGTIYFKEKEMYSAAIYTNSIKFREQLIDGIETISNIRPRFYNQRNGWSIAVSSKKNFVIFLNSLYGESSVHLDRKYNKYKRGLECVLKSSER